MDSLVTAAARALRAGDPLGALKRVALRDDPPALALRDLGWPGKALDEARRTFTRRGDRENALHAGLMLIRRRLLMGEVDAAERLLSALDLRGGSHLSAANGALAAFEIAVRRGQTGPARAALVRAEEAADRSGIPALRAEVERAGRALALPAGRLLARGEERSLVLAQVEELLGSPHLIVDACRRVARRGRRSVGFARRPVLFEVRRVNASHRARLRVEIGRLRRELRPLAAVQATPSGFALVAREAREVLVLAPPIESPDAAVLALLADGEAWSTSALALSLGSSQRTVQRALGQLESEDRVRALGRGRARRWLTAPVTGFTTTLLLPGAAAFG